MYPNLSSLKLLFVCTASNKIGFGHLNRCLVLGKYAQEFGAKICLLFFGNEDILKYKTVNGFDYICLDQNLIHTGEFEKKIKNRVDVIITDILFPGFFSVKSRNLAPSSIFSRLKSFSRLLVAFDVLGKESIINCLQTSEIDIVVSPYIAPDVCQEKTNLKYLTGAKYVPLEKAYYNLPDKKIRKMANRVLVSCGGGDANGNTLEVLNVLESLNIFLEIKVIIGPFFSFKLFSKIKKFIYQSKQKIILINNPNTLLNHMIWCDIAVCTNGLTKYELAASSTPSLLFSVDQHHNEANKPFAKKMTSIDLGIGVSMKDMKKEVTALLENQNLRRSMSIAGGALVDGLGAERIFQKIKKEIVFENSNKDFTNTNK